MTETNEETETNETAAGSEPPQTYPDALLALHDRLPALAEKLSAATGETWTVVEPEGNEFRSILVCAETGMRIRATVAYNWRPPLTAQGGWRAELSVRDPFSNYTMALTRGSPVRYAQVTCSLRRLDAQLVREVVRRLLNEACRATYQARLDEEQAAHVYVARMGMLREALVDAGAQALPTFRQETPHGARDSGPTAPVYWRGLDLRQHGYPRELDIRADISCGPDGTEEPVVEMALQGIPLTLARQVIGLVLACEVERRAAVLPALGACPVCGVRPANEKVGCQECGATTCYYCMRRPDWQTHLCQTCSDQRDAAYEAWKAKRAEERAAEERAV